MQLRGFAAFIFMSLVSSTWLFSSSPTSSPTSPDPCVWRARGSGAPGLDVLDGVMEQFMVSNQVSAAALAVARGQEVVYAKGFAWTTADAPAVEPNALFRIASLSKPITATAVLRLAEQQRLNLDDKVAQWIDLRGQSGRPPDPRLQDITLRHLLQHTGGWDRERSFDPMFRDEAIAKELGKSLPISPADIITSMGSHPLESDPGKAYAYSNYGYCLLGRVMEQCTGQDYETTVRELILDPLDLKHTRLGRTAREDRQPGEVEYECDQANPYTSFRLENLDAHGGWLSSAPDLVRFAAVFETKTARPLLNADSVAALFELPACLAPGSQWTNGAAYYACGWQVRDFGRRGRNIWHTGSLPGTYAFLARWRSGISCAVLFNRRGPGFENIDHLLSEALHGPLGRIRGPSRTVGTQ